MNHQNSSGVECGPSTEFLEMRCWPHSTLLPLLILK